MSILFSSEGPWREVKAFVWQPLFVEELSTGLLRVIPVFQPKRNPLLNHKLTLRPPLMSEVVVLLKKTKFVLFCVDAGN